MDKDFSIELTEREADFINSIIQRNHSVQIFEKYERRKKAEKKLDDMYVAEFTLRPVKKVKKDDDPKSQNNLNNLNAVTVKTLSNQNNTQQNNQNQDKKREQQAIMSRKDAPQSQVKAEKPQHQPRTTKPQEVEFRSSRSQRVSKPTSAYMEFQAQTFKRKFVQKDEPQPVRDLGEELDQRTIKPVIKKQKENLLQISLADIIRKKLQKQSYNNKQKLQPLRVEQQPLNEPTYRMNDNTKQSNDINQQVSQQGEQPVISQTIDTKRQPSRSMNNNAINISLKQTQNQPAMPETRHAKKAIQMIKQPSGDKEQTQKRPTTVQEKQQKKKEPLRSKRLQSKGLKVKYNLSSQPSLTRAWRILQRLKTHKSSWPFRYPVDPIAQGVPDYLQKISHPMDLKTIEKKLKSEKYLSQEQFYEDIQLMIKNSYTYNPKHTNYYKLTKQIESLFNELKHKTYIPKSSGRSMVEGEDEDEEEDYRQVQEEEEEHGESNAINALQQNQHKSPKLTQTGKRKRSDKQLQPSLIDSGKKPTKVIITNQGPQRINQQRQQNPIGGQTTLTSKKPLLPEVSRSAQKKGNKKDEQLEQKRAQPVEGALKRPSTGEKQKIAAQNGQPNNPVQDHITKATPPQNQQRIGYRQQGIPLMCRQNLLYDILHLQSPSSQQQLYTFIKNTPYLYNKLLLKRRPEDETKENLQVNQQIKNEQQSGEEKNPHPEQEEQFELANLDLQACKILRSQVSKLMAQEAHQLTVIANAHPQPNQINAENEIINQ